MMFDFGNCSLRPKNSGICADSVGFCTVPPKILETRSKKTCKGNRIKFLLLLF